MPVFKTTFTVTVLCEEDRREDVQHYMANQDLEFILSQMSDGDFIGQVRVNDTIEVPPTDVREELLAIGNDGEFFAIHHDEEETDDAE